MLLPRGFVDEGGMWPGVPDVGVGRPGFGCPGVIGLVAFSRETKSSVCFRT